MELVHASEILAEALRKSQQWNGTTVSVFELLGDAQEDLGYSDGCRTIATRFIARANDLSSVSVWESRPTTHKATVIMALQKAINEINSTETNPYEGFIFCACMPELQRILLYG